MPITKFIEYLTLICIPIAKLTCLTFSLIWDTIKPRGIFRVSIRIVSNSRMDVNSLNISFTDDNLTASRKWCYESLFNPCMTNIAGHTGCPDNCGQIRVVSSDSGEPDIEI